MKARKKKFIELSQVESFIASQPPAANDKKLLEEIQEKIEKVNAPPPNPSIAFSLTKTGGRIKSDKTHIATSRELCIGRAPTRMGPSLVGVGARTVCNSVAFSRKCDNLAINNLGKILGVRLVCPKNRLSVTPWWRVVFFVRVRAQSTCVFISWEEKSNPFLSVCQIKRTTFSRLRAFNMTNVRLLFQLTIFYEAMLQCNKSSFLFPLSVILFASAIYNKTKPLEKFVQPL